MTMEEAIKKLAKKHEWHEIENVRDPYMVAFSKIIDGRPARINVWPIRMTVGTYITHPKQGKTQLFRKYVTPAEMEKIFKNPRQHTGKGYKRK
jgi:hypothetical protein